MAIMKKALLAAALLASNAIAAPVAGLDARALIIQTVTETDWVTEKVDMTATVWINDADPTAAPVTVIPDLSNATPITTSATTTPTTTLSSTSVDSASTESTTTPSAPTVSPAGFAAEQPSTTATPATSTSSTWSYEAPAPMITQKNTAASSSGTCEGSGNACVGDVTHWDGGLGACGWNVDTNSQMAIALPVGFMGSQSNGNPYCGRSVTILNPNTGTTVQATVGDKCMGCVDRAIDLTDVLFAAVVPGGDGRVSGIQWWLN